MAALVCVDPIKCCICLDPVPAGDNAYTCSTCAVSTCTPCLRNYVNIMCTSVLKCPGFACVAEMNEQATSDRLGSDFKKKLVAISRARLLEDASRYDDVTRTVILPVANRLAKIPGEIKLCEDQVRRVMTKICSVSNKFFDVLDTIFTLKHTPVVCIETPTLDSFPLALGPIMDISSRHWDGQLKRSLATCMSSAEMQILISNDERIMTLFRTTPSLPSFPATSWRSPSLFFCVFFVEVMHAYRFYAPNAPSVMEYLEDFKKHDILGLCFELLISMAKYRPAQSRLRGTWMFCDDLRGALTSDLPHLRRANFDHWPNNEMPLDSYDFMDKTPHENFFIRIWFNLETAETARLALGNTLRSFPCSTLDCKGMFDNKSFACHTCVTNFCGQCHGVLKVGEHHKCDDSERASIEDIVATTKSCPRCACAVFRISGCDQMMCTVCHTLFLFSTGDLVKRTEALHNPHYMQLPAATRALIRAGLGATGGAAGHAQAHDPTGYECLRLQDAQFHLVFLNNIVSIISNVTLHKLATQELRAWELIVEKALRITADTLDIEKSERMIRVQALMGKTLPLPATGNAYRTSKFTNVDKPFDSDKFVSRLRISARTRSNRLRVCADTMAYCDVARDMLVSLSKATKAEVQQELLAALFVFRTESMDKRKRAAKRAAGAPQQDVRPPPALRTANAGAESDNDEVED